MNVLGIDPGAKTTAFTLIDQADNVLLTREAIRPRGQDIWQYAAEVAVIACEIIHQTRLDRIDLDTVGLEDVHAPSPHVRIVNPLPLLETSKIAGVLWATFGQQLIPPIMITPDGLGSRPIEAYPPELVGKNETKGKGQKRHLRSAFDVAVAARKIAVVEAWGAA